MKMLPDYFGCSGIVGEQGTIYDNEWHVYRICVPMPIAQPQAHPRPVVQPRPVARPQPRPRPTAQQLPTARPSAPGPSTVPRPSAPNPAATLLLPDFRATSRPPSRGGQMTRAAAAVGNPQCEWTQNKCFTFPTTTPPYSEQWCGPVNMKGPCHMQAPAGPGPDPYPSTLPPGAPRPVAQPMPTARPSARPSAAPRPSSAPRPSAPTRAPARASMVAAGRQGNPPPAPGPNEWYFACMKACDAMPPGTGQRTACAKACRSLSDEFHPIPGGTPAPDPSPGPMPVAQPMPTPRPQPRPRPVAQPMPTARPSAPRPSSVPRPPARGGQIQRAAVAGRRENASTYIPGCAPGVSNTGDNAIDWLRNTSCC